MKQNSFYQLFTGQLQEIFSAENQILQSLPKMIQAAALPELKDAFQSHLKETQIQIQRLKKIFTHLGIKPEIKACKGIEGILREGEEVIHQFSTSALRDAALISAAQKIEHYEISGYGTARTYAKHLDLDQVAHYLQETLDEEGATNKKLTRLAEGSFFNRGINEEARKEETGLDARKLREINRKLESKDINYKKAKEGTKTAKKNLTGSVKKTATKKAVASKKVYKAAPAKKSAAAKKTSKAKVPTVKTARSLPHTTTRTGRSKPAHAALGGRSTPSRTTHKGVKSQRSGIQARAKK